MKKLLFSLLIAGIVLTGISVSGDAEMVYAYEPASAAAAEPMDISMDIPTPEPAETAPVQETPLPSPEPETTLTEDEIALIALCAMTEAEGESEYGQRLVTDVILNRVDDPHFPDTVYDVIYQKNQFSGMYGERVKRCYVKDELVQLVREELMSRTDHEVVFFRTGHYHSYGVPMFQVGAHYFSSYD